MSPEWRNAYSGPLLPRIMRGHHALTAEQTHGQHKQAAWNRSCGRPLGAAVACRSPGRCSGREG